MIDVASIEARLDADGLHAWAAVVGTQIGHFLDDAPHGDWHHWRAALDALPAFAGDAVSCVNGLLTLSTRSAMDAQTAERLRAALLQLHPWRKGPYRIGSMLIDTEWRSDWKWDRLVPHIEPLMGRLVLDVGCGNGYHCWRAALDGARRAIGIDPTALYTAQFLAIRKLFAATEPTLAERVDLIPIGIESLPADIASFDTVFSMGVLYHRRSPIDHLLELRAALRPGGQLVLETLIVDGDARTVLVPAGRYAKMRNVWFIPSTTMLESWLLRAGFRDVRTVDVTETRVQEQRSTEWMRFESLADFLHPADSRLTIEGYPAPKRAVVLGIG
ncbi:MAG: tRNA 5-methoxyuridine(34)/uridine 5-oxyacetic acid(34) synthase CmoB [Gammaproteobacteria bacterium]|nr:tRNA 5-methoxyuridine(34)/uridine 5-oxyacetic acid(34) synthase CmoB [Gammaproteobacteria bacterium]